jgi:hypothetical protein
MRIRWLLSNGLLVAMKIYCLIFRNSSSAETVNVKLGMDKRGASLQGVVDMGNEVSTLAGEEGLDAVAVALGIRDNNLPAAVHHLRPVSPYAPKQEKIPVTRLVSGMVPDVPMAGEWQSRSREQLILELVEGLKPGEHSKIIALLLVKCTYPDYDAMMARVDAICTDLRNENPDSTGAERGRKALQNWAREIVNASS